MLEFTNAFIDSRRLKVCDLLFRLLALPTAIGCLVNYLILTTYKMKSTCIHTYIVTYLAIFNYGFYSV